MKLITLPACLLVSVKPVFRGCRLQMQATARASPPASVLRSSGHRAAVPSADEETPPSPDTGMATGAGRRPHQRAPCTDASESNEGRTSVASGGGGVVGGPGRREVAMRLGRWDGRPEGRRAAGKERGSRVIDGRD